MTNAFEQVYQVVKRIPVGKVATYGQISRLLGRRYSPLFVGWALNALPEGSHKVPWHRVLDSKGQISVRKVSSESASVQRQLLEGEGVRFDRAGRCNLARFG